MITRAVLVVGMVWICMPQDQKLGPPAQACATPACAAADAGQNEREAVLRRLRGMRNEIRYVRGEATGTGEPKDGEVALQKAGDLPGLIARLDDAAGNMLAGERR